jgi:hypothetical protein
MICSARCARPGSRLVPVELTTRGPEEVEQAPCIAWLTGQQDRYAGARPLAGRAVSSAGRALRLQRRGHWFEPSTAHHLAIVVWCIWTQPASQGPSFIGLHGMSECTEPVPVERGIPVRRETQDVLLCFLLPGARICFAARDSEDPALFLAVATPHRPMLVDRHRPDKRALTSRCGQAPACPCASGHAGAGH